MEKQDDRYYGIIIGINVCLATIPHLLMRPMWRSGNSTNATVIEAIYTMFLLPVLLVIVNALVNKRYAKNSFTINSIVILATIGLSTHMHFKNWADTMGSWNSPDSETKGVMTFIFIVGIIVSLLGIGLVKLRKQDQDRHITPSTDDHRPD